MRCTRGELIVRGPKNTPGIARNLVCYLPTNDLVRSDFLTPFWNCQTCPVGPFGISDADGLQRLPGHHTGEVRTPPIWVRVDDQLIPPCMRHPDHPYI
ncbi:Hypothetical predicted protein [Cloeon dipterum]|uniref:Uncharacterized protein n=1 Tax=Cloeon dipterum TaxID=197152 RepID=A0A8S1E1D3_9INSE|nr:Hypothetical predicted protein [Cloeon dipterum]